MPPALLAAWAWPLRSARAQPAATPAPRIVASFSILADMVRALAPAGSDVSALVGADADAHVFEPRPADGKRLAQADLVVVNGLGFEGWIERLVKVSGYRGPLVVASQGIPPRRTPDLGAHGHAHAHAKDHAHGKTTAGRQPPAAEVGDPHVWQDLALARRMVGNIAAALAERWPGQRDEIGQRKTAYLAQIDALDQRVRQMLDAVPRAQRRVITSHDAFGYFGAAYGVEFMAAQHWSGHAEPSAAAVARLIRQIRQSNARALFIENISDPRLIDRIAKEGGVRVGGTLYSDALSAPGGPADSYLKLVEHNARTLAEAMRAAR